MRTCPILLLLAAGLALAACDDAGGPSDDAGGPSKDGTLVVSTSTREGPPDQDGYQLTIEGVASVTLDPVGTSAIDLPAGHHTLRLLGMAEQCSVSPETPLDVDVPPQDTTSVAFFVSCPPTGVRITTRTTGLDIDLDGYGFAVDGTDRGRLISNGIVVTLLDPGSRTIVLTGLASNCALNGPGARTVTVVWSEIVPVEFVVVCSATGPQPPPISGLLAFESSGDIYVSNIDGSHLGRLTSDGSPNSYNREAAWSPDGSRVAFSKFDGQWGAAIYVIDADGANARRLSPQGAYDATPTWSPDGRRIAFENRRDNQSGGHIFVMNADGTNRVQLTTNRQPNSSPAWSPDGNRIAYVTYPDAGDNDTDIFLMNADGTNGEHLTSAGAGDVDPAWSPDGSRIVFIRAGEPFVADADGANLTRLTPDGLGSNEPAWSPDGLMIAFTRYTNCHLDRYGEPTCHVGIWAIHLPGGPMRELPLHVGLEKGPSWRP